VTADHGAGRDQPRGLALRRLQRRCQAKLNGLQLELPVPFTIQAFCQRLAQRLSRQIVLCPVDTRTGPCGLWVATADIDYFFYERATSKLHQELIVGHEAGHRVFNHHSAEVMPDELADVLGLKVHLVHRMLGRTTYTREEEQEAEVFGTLVVQQAVRAAVPARPPADPAVAAALDRVQAALTGTDTPLHGR
jgi:hypothetical protein